MHGKISVRLDKYGKKVQLYMQMRVRHHTGMFGTAKSVANLIKMLSYKNIYIYIDVCMESAIVPFDYMRWSYIYDHVICAIFACAFRLKVGAKYYDIRRVYYIFDTLFIIRRNFCLFFFFNNSDEARCDHEIWSWCTIWRHVYTNENIEFCATFHSSHCDHMFDWLSIKQQIEILAVSYNEIFVNEL